jgi:hypothetical protein
MSPLYGNYLCFKCGTRNGCEISKILDLSSKPPLKNMNNFYSHFDAIHIILNKLKTIE